MHSPLEVIDGEITGAILTTFTIELPFIDQWLLPRLSQAGVRNIVILADEGQTAEQLSVADSRKAGQDYHLSTIRCPGSFHPKVIYLSGPNHQRACISSANLTSSGQLRNFETAAAITSDDPAHLTALLEVRHFIRQLVANQPAHVVEASAATLDHEQSPPADVRPTVRFVSNLGRPIIDQIPKDLTDGFAPFVGMAALKRLHEMNAPRLWADKRRPEAFTRDKASGPTLRPIEFIFGEKDRYPRVVHGKALWHSDGWCLVGSPNLTDQGLLRAAKVGNVEAALLFEQAPGFKLPEFIEADRPDLPAPTGEPDQEQRSTPTRIFSAVLDGELRVGGIDGLDNSKIEYATVSGWAVLGEVRSDVVVYDELLTPKRLRVRLPNGSYAYAIVHRTAHLRARQRSPLMRSASVVEKLPLDLQGVNKLQEVLGELFTLDELVSEERLKNRSTSPTSPNATDEEPIDTWRPARPDDEPRVPDLYRTLYPGEPDAFLALTRRVLRIESEQPEEVALEDNEELQDDDIDLEAEQSPERAPRSTAAVVKRYRNSLLKVLDRGAERISKPGDPAMRDLIFLTVLRFHETLSSLTVQIDAKEARTLRVPSERIADETVEVHLVEPEHLIKGRFELLDAYLSAAPDVVGDCASTVLGHLSAAVDAREQLSAPQQRRLDDLCFQVAQPVLNNGNPTVAEIGWLSPQARVDLLQPYADRIDWYAVVDHVAAEGWLHNADLEDEPYPVVTGGGSIANSFSSPAWTVLGHACIAGYEDEDPFGVIIESADSDSPFLIHVLRVQPTDRKQIGDQIQEVLLRRTDQKWLALTYQGFRRKSADDIMTTVGARRVLDRLSKSKQTESSIPPEWLPDLPILAPFVPPKSDPAPMRN